MGDVIPNAENEAERFRDVLDEVARHDWERLRCMCRSPRGAAHVAEALVRLTTARLPEEVALDGLEGHLHFLGMTSDCAPAGASVIMAALANDAVIPRARLELLRLLQAVLSDDSHYAGECRQAISGDLWPVYRELFAGGPTDVSVAAYEVLCCIDDEHERLRSFQRALGDRLPPGLEIEEGFRAPRERPR